MSSEIDELKAKLALAVLNWEGRELIFKNSLAAAEGRCAELKAQLEADPTREGHWFLKFHEVRCNEGRLCQRIERLDAACAQKDAQIAELKADYDAAQDSLHRFAQRNVAMAELLDRVPHDGNEAGCFKNCPRCAYEKKLKREQGGMV